MSTKTNIEWTLHTGGPWLGCTEVSPGCAKCYARELAQQRLEHIFRKAYKSAGFADWETRPVWGDKAPRVLTKGFWKDALAWNRAAEKKGERCLVFPSMIDWLDDMPAGIIDQDGDWLDKNEVLARFLSVIHDTPNLIWQLLTKRPENWRAQIDDAFDHLMEAGIPGNEWLGEWLDGKAPENVWVGASVEDQPRAKRIQALSQIPAIVRFLSCEPLLGAIDLRYAAFNGSDSFSGSLKDAVNWVIVGGESGPGARPCNVEWIRDIVAQCKATGVPVFVKQLGAHPVIGGIELPLSDKKGGDTSEWVDDLRVREFPI